MSEKGIDDFVTLTVRGLQFDIPTRIQSEHPKCKLSRILLETTSSQRLLMMGRDPGIFGCIISFYTSGSLHVPRGTCATLVKEELEFWEIPVEMMCHACFWRYKEELDEMRNVENCVKLWNSEGSIGRDDVKVSSETMYEEGSHVREQLSVFLAEPCSSQRAKVYFCFIMLVNLVSVILPAIDTVPLMRHLITDPKAAHNSTSDMAIYSSPHLHFNATIDFFRATRPTSWVMILDVVMAALLTLDLTLKLYITKRKRNFFKCIINLCGILSLIPVWVYFSIFIFAKFINIPMEVMDRVQGLMCLVVFRVVYLIRMAIWYEPMKIIILALKESRRELFLLILILTLNSVLFGFLVYTVELNHNTFWSIPEGIYWAVVTMTTVGYGDLHAVGQWGRIVSCCCAISGILLLALPVPIIANNFIKYYTISKITKEPICNCKK